MGWPYWWRLLLQFVNVKALYKVNGTALVEMGWSYLAHVTTAINMGWP